MSSWKVEKQQPGQGTTQACHSQVGLEPLVMQVHPYAQSHAVKQKNKYMHSASSVTMTNELYDSFNITYTMAIRQSRSGVCLQWGTEANL